MSFDPAEEFREDFHDIIVDATPLIDVRAPKEYEQGSVPNAVNLPLMNNEERHRVGRCYNEAGHEAAVELGHELVSGEVKKKRVGAWRDFVEANPDAAIYCARGGMRSEIVQGWIYEATGGVIPRLKGGFKALRNYLIEQLQPENQAADVITLGGYTGSGKTVLLNKLENSIDLEGLANHRGSGFGSFLDSQPPPVDFENSLAAELIKHREQGYKHLLIEDESQHIGKLFIPNPIFDYFTSGKMVLLEVPIQKRVKNIFDEYVVEAQEKYVEHFGCEEGLDNWYESMRESFDNVKERLGGARHQKLTGILDEAFQRQLKSNELERHKGWIEGLLEHYYDPLYGHHLDNLSREVLFKGDSREVLDYFESLDLY